MMEFFLYAQFIGAAGLVAAVGVFQADTRKGMLKLNILSSVLFSIQFFMLGAFSGAAVSAISALRSFVFFKTVPKKSNVWILGIFMGLAVAAIIFTWQGYISLFALTANLINGLALWQKKPKLMRHFAILAPPFWIVYSLYFLAIPVFIVEICILISILVGNQRFDHRHVHMKHVR